MDALFNKRLCYNRNMENTPWKPILIATTASLILLFAVYVFVLPKKATFDEERIEKIAEFQNTRVAGHKEGKKVWVFYAKQGWMDRGKTTTHLRDVEKGMLYKNGDLIVRNLRAPRIKAFRHSEIIEAYGESTDKYKLSAQIAFTPKKKGKKREFANLNADFLRYNPNTEKSEIERNIKVVEKEVTLYAQKMLVDHDKETADLEKDIKVVRSDINLTCQKLHYDSNQEKLNAWGKVRSKIKGSPEAYVNASSMDLFADDKKDVNIKGDLRITQGKKASVADQAIYNKEKGKLVLTGNVHSIIEKGEALLKEDTARKLRSKEAKELLGDKTLLDADKLVMYTENGNADAYGNVYVTQKGREAKAERAAYSEETEIITLTGDVFMKKEKQWVKCQSVDISVKDETFEAFGEVESEFKIKK